MLRKSKLHKLYYIYSQSNIYFTIVILAFALLQIAWSKFPANDTHIENIRPKAEHYAINQSVAEQNNDEISDPKLLKEVITKKLDPYKKLETPIETNYLQGKFNPKKHKKFREIPLKYSWSANLLLRDETLEAFKKMHQDAENEGVQLVIKSATRPFHHQKWIWERKWNGKKRVNGMNLAKKILDPYLRANTILQNSAMPGVSRHHWGTEVDLNAFTNKYFDYGKGKKAYTWLIENAHRYGFCQPYSSKTFEPNRRGHREERWHWSFFPLANKFQQEYSNKLKITDISGFLGSDTAPKVDVIESFAKGISSNCTANKLIYNIDIPTNYLGR